MGIKIEIDYETSSAVLVSELIDSLECLDEHIEVLLSIPENERKSYQNEDLMYDLLIRESVINVLRYYTTHTEWAALGIDI